MPSLCCAYSAWPALGQHIGEHPLGLRGVAVPRGAPVQERTNQVAGDVGGGRRGYGRKDAVDDHPWLLLADAVRRIMRTSSSVRGGLQRSLFATSSSAASSLSEWPRRRRLPAMLVSAVFLWPSGMACSASGAAGWLAAACASLALRTGEDTRQSFGAAAVHVLIAWRAGRDDVATVGANVHGRSQFASTVADSVPVRLVVHVQAAARSLHQRGGLDTRTVLLLQVRPTVVAIYFAARVHVHHHQLAGSGGHAIDAFGFLAHHAQISTSSVVASSRPFRVSGALYLSPYSTPLHGNTRHPAGGAIQCCRQRVGVAHRSTDRATRMYPFNRPAASLRQCGMRWPSPRPWAWSSPQ